ncbi:uncharacterized protein LOC120340844 isoform X2 [Styela clava]
MPQEFMILKCFTCSMFQVHQIRKSKTWTCKMCNEKQSQQKLYGQGSGKECRMMVQQLNIKKRELEDVEIADLDVETVQGVRTKTQSTNGGSQTSKWQIFKESSNIPEDSCHKSSDDEDDRRMTPYHIKNIITSTTLDVDEWSGNRKRKMRGNNTKQAKHDKDFIVDQIMKPERENVNVGVSPPKIPNFSMRKDVPMKRCYESTTVAVATQNSESATSSKWSKFGSKEEDSDENSSGEDYLT